MARTPTRELAEIVRLQKGRHRRPEDGVCAMELVAWMSGESHTDHPQSVSPVIAAFSRCFNDALDPSHRQRLGLLTARMIDTVGSREVELVRSEMLWNWMIMTALPEWLAAAQRPDLAATVAINRSAALNSAIVSLDVYGHATVRPADDHRTSSSVSSALAVAGVTGACVAGNGAADGVSGSGARRRWETAHVVARAAAWSVAECRGAATVRSEAQLWRTAENLRERAFVLLEALIEAAPPAPPAPPPPPPLVKNDAMSAICSPEESPITAGR
jgi:hypothetical protein